jgi:hypothetical protein
VRTNHRLRALAAAILAAGLSWAGHGALAFVSAPDALSRQADGQGEESFVARPASAATRLAVRPGRAAPDQAASEGVAVLAAPVSLAPPQAAPAPAPRVALRGVPTVPVTSRSPRGPPAA